MALDYISNKKTRILRGIIYTFFIFTAAQAVAGPQAETKSRITVASGVRLRSSPATSADEVARLQIGAVVRELERSAGKEKIGNSEDYWYRVVTGDGKEGWLFGGFTAAFNANDPAESYRRIAAERLRVEKLSFGDLTDLARFLAAARADVKDTSAQAELEFARLLAMKRALAEVPADYTEQSPFGAWIKANEASLIYSDPAAVYFLKSQLFWDLQKKYAALAIAERIAWEAATNPLGGECEGYVPCHLGAINLTLGRYLMLYPRGAHAEEAVSTVTEDLNSLYDLAKSDKPDAQDKTDARKEIASIRAALMKTAAPKKGAALELLDKLSQRYR